MTMKLNSWGAVSLGALGLIVILTIVSSVEGGAIRNSREISSPHVIRKRNAWWSKKSTDDVNRIAEVQKAELRGQTLEDLQEVREAIACYTEGCVPEFVYCGRRTVRSGGFYKCKLQHRFCAARCFNAPTSMQDAI